MGAINLEFIKQRRKLYKINQEDMAARLFLGSAQAYSPYETGKSDFKAEHLPKLCEILNCSIEDLYVEALPNGSNEKAVLDAVRKIVGNE